MFVPLRVFSEYSLLESSITPEKMIAYCKQYNINTVAVADSNNMFGIMSWSLALQKAGIKAIVGCILNISKGRIWIYCKNDEGFRTLSNILTKSYMERSGTLLLEDLADFNLQNVMILCDYSLNKEEISFLAKKCEIGIAISRQKTDLEFEIDLFKIANELELPLVAAPLAYYFKTDEFLAVDALWCIKHGSYLAADDRPRVLDDAELKDPELINELFKGIPWAIQNAEILAQKCNFLLKTHPPRMPALDDVDDPDSVMKKRALDGLAVRLEKYVLPEVATELKDQVRKEYEQRLNMEIEMISKMGFCAYFLIVSDIVSWAKHSDIPVGPGRGSGASCLVAWCLNITNLDPLRFKLMFERFLNPDRVSLPDFDIDFCQDKRWMVIEYIQRRYGKENVAHIITFGSLQYRAAIRDIARVMQFPYSKADEICKKLPPPFQGVAPTLKQLHEEGALADLINDESAELFQIAEMVEGAPRHSSVHAAGVVIGNKRLSDILPLYKDPHLEMPIIQFAMKQAEQIGLVKFDILGLSVLSVLRKTIEFLSEDGINLDLDSIHLDDEPTFELLRKGITKGLFQLDTPGLQNLMLEMQPTCFEDIIAAGALFRPGPMADIPQFVRCKRGFDKIEYTYPEMESILKDTYGVIVYQEQVLQIAKEMAGYSLKDADLLRRAMGKKIKKEMSEHEEKFVKNVAQICGGGEEKAKILFGNLSRFASYGFPKAHAAPYALMSFQTAYCKSHYTAEFLCASLCFENTLEKSEQLIQESRKLGISVLRPCVNESAESFSIEKVGNEKAIRYGLNHIKGVGDSSKQIIEARKNGKFKSVEDFLGRVKTNKRVLEALVFSGAFDSFSENRAEIFDIISNPEGVSTISLFNFEREIKIWNEFEVIEKEFSVLNTVLSQSFLQRLDLTKFKIFSRLSSAGNLGLVCVLVICNKLRQTRDNKEINVFSFLDQDGIQELISFNAPKGEWKLAIIEFEKIANRVNIKNSWSFEDFFARFRKAFFKIQVLEEIDSLKANFSHCKAGNVSFFADLNGESIFLGNFKMDLEFLRKYATKINSVM